MKTVDMGGDHLSERVSMRVRVGGKEYAGVCVVGKVTGMCQYCAYERGWQDDKDGREVCRLINGRGRDVSWQSTHF